jgi:hypothetical protein
LQPLPPPHLYQQQPQHLQQQQQRQEDYARQPLQQQQMQQETTMPRHKRHTSTTPSVPFALFMQFCRSPKHSLAPRYYSVEAARAAFIYSKMAGIDCFRNARNDNLKLIDFFEALGECFESASSSWSLTCRVESTHCCC